MNDKIDFEKIARVANAGRMQLERFRAEYYLLWPTPPTGDAARFVLTELGEAQIAAMGMLFGVLSDTDPKVGVRTAIAALGSSVDANLRSRGGYTRNRTHSRDFINELGDVYMMLLTVADKPIDPTRGGKRWVPEDFDVLSVSVMSAIIAVLMGFDSGQYKTGEAILDVASFMIAKMNLDPNAILEFRLERIREKITKDRE